MLYRFNFNLRFIISLKLGFFISFLVFALFLEQGSKAQSIIKGNLIIDTTIWSPVAYLSIIPDLTEINTMTNDMIIEETKIDKFGNFTFNTHFLPSEDNLYRIHISKKGDSPASLIIGGKEENHFFLIANNISEIIIRDSSNVSFLKDISISGYYPNRMLQQIDEIANFLDSTSFNGSSIKIELVRNAIYEKLRFYADTCSHPIVSLYALYKSNFEKNYPLNQQFYKSYLKRWRHDQSSYFKAIRKSLQLTKDKELLYPILISIVFFGLGVLLTLIFIRMRVKDQNLLKDLSVQERKIFALLMEGKSNKEISDALTIGISTVKSHINSIYSKLDIKSRKEALNLDKDAKN